MAQKYRSAGATPGRKTGFNEAAPVMAQKSGRCEGGRISVRDASMRLRRLWRRNFPELHEFRPDRIGFNEAAPVMAQKFLTSAAHAIGLSEASMRLRRLWRRNSVD